jgi:hypothetical protein
VSAFISGQELSWLFYEEAVRPILDATFPASGTVRRCSAARPVKALATDKPFGVIAAGQTHFALLPLTRLTATEK